LSCTASGKGSGKVAVDVMVGDGSAVGTGVDTAVFVLVGTGLDVGVICFSVVPQAVAKIVNTTIIWKENHLEFLMANLYRYW